MKFRIFSCVVAIAVSEHSLPTEVKRLVAILPQDVCRIEEADTGAWIHFRCDTSIKVAEPFAEVVATMEKT